jgi:hypothetical protein
LKEQIGVAAIAILLMAAGLFSWHVADLTDCRDHVRNGSSASGVYVLKCPKIGPYGPNSNVLLFAVLSPLLPSATAGLSLRRQTEARSMLLPLPVVQVRDAP